MVRQKRVKLSPSLLPLALESQLLPGSFARSVYQLVDSLDLSPFDAHYRNDETGASARPSSTLLVAVLLDYTRGWVISRAIERTCRERVLFVALTGITRPHFTTIADFVGHSRDQTATLFGKVLALLDAEGLIGRKLFALGL